MDLQELVPSFATLKAIATAIALLIAGWLGSKWAYRIGVRALSRTRLDQALVRFLASMLRYIVLAATFIASMGAVGIHSTSLVAVVASAGLAVGLALQGSRRGRHQADEPDAAHPSPAEQDGVLAAAA